MWKRWMPWFAAGTVAVALLLMVTFLSADPRSGAVAAQQPKDKDGKEMKGQSKDPDVNITPSRVAAVTVYPGSALVSREVDVPAGKGLIELTVSPMPPSTILSSLYSEGTDGIRVLTTRFRTRAIERDNRADVRKFTDELSQLALAREKLQADISAIQENFKMLGKMEGFMGVTTIQGTEKGLLNAEAAIAMAKHIKDSRIETSRELVNLHQQVKANQDKAEFAQRQLNEVNTGAPRTERDAVLTVDRGANAAAGKIRLNYLVSSATWRPQYKLRAGKAAKDPVLIESLASLVQHTGEDWTNVNLILSTAQPMLNAAPPELQSLNVGVVHKGAVPPRKNNTAEVEEMIRVLRSKAQKDFNERKPTTGIGLFNTAAALDQSWELLNPDAAVQRGCALAMREGPTITYQVTTPMSVPSRTDEQVLEVARIELPADFYYKSVPLLTTHVYRLADLVNKSNFVLLPGDATMYIGSDFVGQMYLPLVAIGEPFTVGFGVDAQLQVKRQMVDKAHTTQGGNQMLRYEYRSTVSNFKNEKIKLQVWDRLPKADTDAVTINITKSTPELSKDPAYLRGPRTKNLLRWDVTVEPGANGEKAFSIQYEFKLELDRQMTITDFQSAGVFGQPNPISSPIIAAVSPADQARIDAALAKLNPNDQRLAQAQLFCAIDQDSRLGSIGPIHKLMIKGQPVFLCCKGCEAEAQAHPDDTLLKVQNLMSRLNVKR